MWYSHAENQCKCERMHVDKTIRLESMRQTRILLPLIYVLLVCVVFYQVVLLLGVGLRSFLSGTPSALPQPLQSDVRRNNGDVVEQTNFAQNVPYKFRLPPYSYLGEALTEKHITVHNDVCTDWVPGSLEASRIVVFNHNDPTRRTLETFGFHEGFIITWPLVYRAGPPPPEEGYVWMDGPAFFFMQRRAHNFYHFVEEGLRGLFPMLEVTGRLAANDSPNYIYHFECKNPIADSPFAELVHALGGARTHVRGCVRHAARGACFRHAAFGFVRRQEQDRQRFVNHLLTAYNAPPCSGGRDPATAPRVIFLDRASRRVSNTHALAAAAARALPRARVTVERFDKAANVSLRRQIHMMSCCRLLIGVHGAGLEWLQFLPSDAALVELGWRRQPAHMWYDFARRRGLVSAKMAADDVTINWENFMRAQNNVTYILTEEKKKQLLAEANKIPTWRNDNPYKFGEAVMNEHKFVTELMKVVEQLEDKFGLNFR